MISLPPTTTAAHSRLSTKINVDFVTIQPVTIEIKQRLNDPPVPPPTPLINLSFFPVTRMTAFTNRQNSLSLAKVALPMIEPSLTERRGSPAEIMTRLLQPLSTIGEKDSANNSDQNKVHRTAGQTGTPSKPVDSKSSKPAQSGLKPAEFNLEAPWAKSVKLAADFTEWEKHPLDLIKTEKGVWSIIVWLAPGKYAYRFIVDDQWYDDPHSVQRITNPFGTTNTVIHVH